MNQSINQFFEFLLHSCVKVFSTLLSTGACPLMCIPLMHGRIYVDQHKINRLAASCLGLLLSTNGVGGRCLLYDFTAPLHVHSPILAPVLLGSLPWPAAAHTDSPQASRQARGRLGSVSRDLPNNNALISEK